MGRPGRPKKKLKVTKQSLKMKMKSTGKAAAKKGSIKVKLQKVKKMEPQPEPPAEKPKTKPKHPYQMYTQEDLIAAVKAVKEKGMSTYKAAEMFGIPKSTVHDKVAGKSNIMFQRKGPAPLLSYEDEKKLVDYLLQMSSLGYMHSIQELRNLASELAIEKGKLSEGCLLSPRWHKSFRSRWPVLNEKVFGSFRTCEKKKKDNKRENKTLETFEYEEDGESIQISSLASDADICLSNYYTELHILLSKYELLNKPARIYCIDEVAIQYESGNPKTKQIKALKNQVTSRTETTVVSLIGCGNALGNALPPFLIYPGDSLNENLLRGRYPGVQGTTTENGLTDYSTMKHYLDHHFIEYALLGMKKNPPVLIMYDGTKSKISPDTIAWAKNRNIILFVLPPNSRSQYYPIEKGCFRTFKDFFLRETRIFRELYNIDSITKSSICKIVSEAYPQALSTKNLVEMFEDAGLYPFKPSIVLCEDIRNERFERKLKLHSIKKRPPGMRDKGVQVVAREETSINLIKSGRKRIITQHDDTVTDTDSTMAFLRDKKIAKMLEGTSNSRQKRDESDYTDSEEDYEDELDDEPETEVKPRVHQPASTYYLMSEAGTQSLSQPITSTSTSTQYNTGTQHQYAADTPEHQYGIEEKQVQDFRIEETHAYALNPSGASAAAATPKSEISQMDSIEQTRVAVQALQDIANEIQLISSTSMQNNGTVQNVTLNSGRMIQVVVQEQEQIIEEVEQIEIDNSVESIIPMDHEVVIAENS